MKDDHSGVGLEGPRDPRHRDAGVPWELCEGPPSSPLPCPPLRVAALGLAGSLVALAGL